MPLTPEQELELLQLEEEEANAAKPSIQPHAPSAWNPMAAGTTGRAATQGFAQGGTLGFADELGGALGAATLPSGIGVRPESLAPSPDDTPEVAAAKKAILAHQAAQPTNYQLVRDRMRAENEQAKAAHPGAYLGGELAGGIATTPLLPGVGGAKTFGQLVRTGAALGAAGGLGSSNADTLGGMARDTALGGAGGALAGGAGFVAGKTLPGALRAARGKLEDVATKYGTRAIMNGAGTLARREPVRPESVIEAIRSGAIVPLGTTRGAAQRLGGMTDALGTTYSEMVDRLSALGVPGPRAAEVADELIRRGAALEPNTMNAALPAEYLSQAETVLGKAGNSPNLKLTQAEALKRSLQDMAKYGRLEETPLNEVKRDAASVFRQANEDAIAKAVAANPGTEIADLGDAFVPVKQRLGRLIDARDWAEKGAAAGAKRSPISLTDMAAAGLGMGHAGAGGAALYGTLSHLAKSRLPSTIASGAYYGSRGANALARAALLSTGRYPAIGAGLGAVERALLPDALIEDPAIRRQRALAEALRSGGTP